MKCSRCYTGGSSAIDAGQSLPGEKIVNTLIKIAAKKTIDSDE
ncbi:hypothetical protein [Undibacterium sp. Jales W-56]|nr:hypothetical protein [Undibacterium sp. Jales W-56]